MIEILKVKREFLYLLLTLTQEKNVKVARFPLIYLDETILAHTNLAEFRKFLQESENEALLDRIDSGLVSGSIDLTLPDGTFRKLGGRSSGFEATVHLRSWRGLLRAATAGSVGVYQGWEAGDWTSADPVQLFAIFVANADSLGDVARAHGPWRWLGRALHLIRRNNRAGSRRNINKLKSQPTENVKNPAKIMSLRKCAPCAMRTNPMADPKKIPEISTERAQLLRMNLKSITK